MKEFCKKVYHNVYQETKRNLEDKENASRNSETRMNEIEAAAQKEAIKQSIILTMKQFPNNDVAEIWKTIYEVHIHRKSGIDDSFVIQNVISADQSWKKSSGHAFEEMVKVLANDCFKDDNIEVILQRDLNILIKADEIANEPRDISWLKEQIKEQVFDLYAIVRHEGKRYCFGCIQCKTSIRDRVTRDREPSLHAMQSFFWSVAIVLDGSFLKLPKFITMVNGGGNEHQINGWHGLYVFSDEKPVGRIYHTNLELDVFKQHAIIASTFWLKQRQWLDITFDAEKLE